MILNPNLSPATHDLTRFLLPSPLTLAQSQIASAQRRILISTLYIGTGQLERKLIDSIEAAINQRPDLEVTLLVDAVRATRPSSSGSTLDLLAPLVDRHPKAIRVLAYHHPSLRQSWLLSNLLPHRWQELVGVQHIKVYLFDDNVLLSGANLSHDYFINRQDRAWLFNSSPQLATYYCDLIQYLTPHCLRLTPSNGDQRSSSTTPHPYNFNAEDHPTATESLQTTLARFTSKQLDLHSANQHVDGEELDEQSVLLIPTLQFGPVGVDQESRLIDQLLKGLTSVRNFNLRLTLVSGYLGLTPYLVDHLACLVDRQSTTTTSYNSSSTQQEPMQMEILCASPSANGFLNSSGLSGYIPMAYRESLIDLMTRLSSPREQEEATSTDDEDSLVKFYEYSRPDWTFHAKGLWLEETSNSDHLRQGSIMTNIGSSNFNYRSTARDLECQLFVLTSSPSLKSGMLAERNRLFNASYCNRVRLGDLQVQGHFRLPWQARFLHRFMTWFM